MNNSLRSIMTAKGSKICYKDIFSKDFKFIFRGLEETFIKIREETFTFNQ
jgi:hypothetical protein